MKKVQAINFLDENKKEATYFRILITLLIILLLFQVISYMKSINELESEINEIKSSINIKKPKVEVEKSTLLEDTKIVYDLLGFSNVDSVSIENNKVALEGKCENLEMLDELKAMDNIKDVSINSVEKQDDKYLFKVIYHIGG